MVEEYFEMLKRYETNKISGDEWMLYCTMVLKDLMFLHRDVLEEIEKKER